MAATNMKELRGLAPIELVQALDAIAMARGMDRNAYVNAVLERHVRSYLDELSVVHTTLRGNPLLTEDSRSPAEISQFGGLRA